MNPLLLPPRLVLRALDDLHTLARVASGLEEVEARMNERLEIVIELGERIADAGESIDGRLDDVVALGERVDELVALGDRVDAVVTTGDKLDAAAREVADSARQLAEALPILARAAQMVGPLEGAVERLGRIVDRLPGGARGRGAA